MGIGNRANGSHHARLDYKRSRVRRERVGKSKSSREGSVEGLSFPKIPSSLGVASSSRIIA
jgi:hypothetical protein